MKKELLEHIIRQCVKEVLQIIPEVEQMGAPAPPAAGLGTADQPAVPDVDTPTFTADTTGIFFVDPKNPNKPVKQNLAMKDDAALERDLYKVASKAGGPRIRIASNTLRSVKNFLQTPNAPIFLYVGKQDPDTEELYLLADKTFQGAKNNSIGPDAQAGYDTTAVASDDDKDASQVVAQQVSGNKTQAPDIDENKFRNMISSMVRETLKEMSH